MIDENAMCAKPTLRQRLWWRLGYQWRIAETPAGAEALQGWMKTEVVVCLSFSDRLRLLLSGRLRLNVINHTDIQIGRAIASTDVLVVPPGVDQ